MTSTRGLKIVSKMNIITRRKLDKKVLLKNSTLHLKLGKGSSSAGHASSTSLISSLTRWHFFRSIQFFRIIGEKFVFFSWKIPWQNWDVSQWFDLDFQKLWFFLMIYVFLQIYARQTLKKTCNVWVHVNSERVKILHTFCNWNKNGGGFFFALWRLFVISQ